MRESMDGLFSHILRKKKKKTFTVKNNNNNKNSIVAENLSIHLQTA